VAKAFYSRGVRKGQRGDSDGAIADFTAAMALPQAPPEVVEAARRRLADELGWRRN
jgi:2-methylcitrate dehydratase PrpD